MYYTYNNIIDLRNPSKLLKKLIFIFLIFVPITCFSQLQGINKVDSLRKKLIESEIDSNRLKIYIELSMLYVNVDPQVGLEYAEKADILSDKLGLEKIKSDVYNCYGANYFMGNHNLDSAEIYFYKSFEIAERFEDKPSIAASYSYISNLFSYRNDFKKALEYAEKTLEINKELNDTLSIGKTLIDFGNIYYYQSIYHKALEFFFQAESIFKKQKDSSSLLVLYSNIGNIYFFREEWDEASRYYNLALKGYNKEGNISGKSIVLQSMGLVALNENKFDKAIKYLNEALKLSLDLDNTFGISSITENLGTAYQLKKDYKNALKYMQKALEMNLKNKDTFLLAQNYGNIGALYFLLSQDSVINKLPSDYGINLNKNLNIEQGIDLTLKAIELSSKIGDDYSIREFNKNLFQVYEKIGNYKQALYFYKDYVMVNDSINSIQAQTKIAELEATRDNQLKEAEIESLKIKQFAEKKQNQIIVYSLVIGIILILIFVLVLYLRYKKERNLKRTIEEQNKIVNNKNIELNEKNKQITNQNLELESLNAELTDRNIEITQNQEELINLNIQLSELNNTKDKFFSIIAHDLKNPFAGLYINAELLSFYYDNFSEEERKKNIDKLLFSAKQLKELLENLLQWSRTQLGKMTFDPQETNINKLIVDSINLLKNNAEDKNIKINYKSKDNISSVVDSNMISTVLQNLITNAIKFTYENGEIDIISTIDNNQVIVEIKDNGVGIKENDLEKLFRLDSNFSTIGTSNEKGTGLGLILCKEFIEKNNGMIWVVSEYGKGSSFKFTLPLT